MDIKLMISWGYIIYTFPSGLHNRNSDKNYEINVIIAYVIIM